MPIPWSIRVARIVFFVVAIALGAAITAGYKFPVWKGVVGGALVGAGFILIDSVLGKFSLREFSFATFGLMIGLFCAWLITKVGFLDLPWFRTLDDTDSLKGVVEVCIYAVLSFLGITLALRSDRDQFSFIIPYVRFRRDASEGEPMLLDTNIIIDGRIPAVFATGFLSGSFVIPRFVLNELQRLADSADPIKSERGRRGLDHVQTLRETPGIDVTVHNDHFHEGEPVDSLLVTLARELNARLLTNDVNVGKVAKLRGVSVLNFNQLARSLQPDVAPGDEMELSLIKPGRDKHQAVGYLPNGAMIVVNNAARFIGETVQIRVSGLTQTSAGRLIFAELLGEAQLRPAG